MIFFDQKLKRTGCIWKAHWLQKMVLMRMLFFPNNPEIGVGGLKIKIYYMVSFFIFNNQNKKHFEYKISSYRDEFS